MMLTTHALVGPALAVPVAVLAPEFAPVALWSGLVGGALPDLDILARHRRTLHYPRYYTVVASLAAAVALAHPTHATVALSLASAGAAAHSLMDVLGGSPETRPWERETDRAVYDHYTGVWLRARRWIRYDGAPEDLLLALAVAAPVVYVSPSLALDAVVRAAVLVSVLYTVFRRRVATAVESANPAFLASPHGDAGDASDKPSSDKTL